LERVRLQLFVAGESLQSRRAIDNLERLRTVDVDLDIVDVLADPEAAEQARVVATPTVVRLAPAPVRRVVGDLSDLEAVAACLDLQLSNPMGGS
jgi:circadian clock protein KaiB